MSRPLHVVILAAGHGTRMKSLLPKVLHQLGGVSSLGHVVALGGSLEAATITVVVSPENHSECAASLSSESLRWVEQDPPRGTGHAVQVALAELAETGPGDVLVLYGDGPLYQTETLQALVTSHRGAGCAATILTTMMDQPEGYGRIIENDLGQVERIVEELDADDSIRAIHEVNTGVLVFRLEDGRVALDALTCENAKGEYYLTDLVGGLVSSELAVGKEVLPDFREAHAFNTYVELARARTYLRDRINAEHQGNGIDIIDPATTFIDCDVEIGAGTTILPFTVIGRGVKVGKNCSVGPFSHLRMQTVMEDQSEVGNFVEVKKTRIGSGTKAKHLTYLGDTVIGEAANIGCGTITANYDGREKHMTTIGDGAFIGSGTVIVAPAEVGKGGVTGAGAVIKKNTVVGEGETYVGVPARPISSGGKKSGDGEGERLS